MKELRNRQMVIGDMLLTGMTATEVKKLGKIMSQPDVTPDPRLISVEDYIAIYHPNTREWTSKKGTAMIAVEILHDVIDRPEDEVAFPLDCIYRNAFWLK